MAGAKVTLNGCEKDFAEFQRVYYLDSKLTRNELRGACPKDVLYKMLPGGVVVLRLTPEADELKVQTNLNFVKIAETYMLPQTPFSLAYGQTAKLRIGHLDFELTAERLKEASAG